MVKDSSMYETFTCTTCGKGFSRYKCHPYIKECPTCRKGKRAFSGGKTTSVGRSTESKWNRRKKLQYLTNTGNYGKVIRDCCMRNIKIMLDKGMGHKECDGHKCENSFRNLKNGVIGFGYASYKMSKDGTHLELKKDYVDNLMGSSKVA